MTNSEFTARYIKTDADRLWLDEGLRFGYRLRKPAAPGWRLPLVRHVRAIAHAIRVEIWNRRFEAVGIKPPGYEGWLTRAIWKGWQ